MKSPMKPKRIEHRCVKADGAFVKRRRPVEDFDGRGNGHQKAEERKHRAGVYRLPAHEHVMAPDEEAEHRDGDTRVGHKPVAKDALTRKAGDDLADDPHAGQDHDIHRRVRVEPEEMLEQDRIATQRGVENTDAEHALERHEKQRNRKHRRGQHQDQARRVKGPDKQRQPEPSQTGRSHFVDCDDEVQPGGDRCEPCNEDSRRHGNDGAVRIGAAVGRIKRPPVSTPPATIAKTAKNAPNIKIYQLARLSRGKATSRAPIINGRRKFPSTVGTEGIRKNHTMITPCMVKSLL